jgi:cell division protein FtsB
MRLATVVLLALLGLVHAELWFGHGGVPRVRELEQRLAQQRVDNDAARARNERLLAEVLDLKEGLEMVEERARHDLGMLKADEILVQIAAPAASAPGGSAARSVAVLPAAAFVVRGGAAAAAARAAASRPVPPRSPHPASAPAR